MKKLGNMLALIALALTLASPISAATGKKVFNKCKACHSLVEGKNKVGPSLYGIMNRIAGTVPKYKYSPALKNSGLQWTEGMLDQWLMNPTKLVKKTKMRTKLRKAKDRRAVIKYLRSLQK